MNGSHDRETVGLSTSGFVTAITDSLNRTYGDPHKSLKNHVSLLYIPLNNLLEQWCNIICKLNRRFLLGPKFNNSFENACLFSSKISLLFLCCVQPNDYVNAILVPEGGQVPLDVENLAAQGIFHVVSISSLLAVMEIIDLERMRKCCFPYCFTQQVIFVSLVLAGMINL